jgi:hypothetical protein
MVYRRSLDRVAMAFKKEMMMVDLKSDSVLWQYTPARSGGSFTSADISPNNRFVACGVDINLGRKAEISKRHVTGYIYVYDIDGLTVAELKVTYGGFGAGLPDVCFSADNRTIVVETRDTLRLVEMY